MLHLVCLHKTEGYLRQKRKHLATQKLHIRISSQTTLAFYLFSNYATSYYFLVTLQLLSMVYIYKLIHTIQRVIYHTKWNVSKCTYRIIRNALRPHWSEKWGNYQVFLPQVCQSETRRVRDAYSNELSSSCSPAHLSN